MTVSITQVSPSSSNATAWTPIVLDVTTITATTYTYIFMVVGSQHVVVYDGVWNPAFANGSSRAELIAGRSYRYTIIPNAGWTAGFSLEVFADEADNEAWSSLTHSLYFPTGTQYSALVGAGNNIFTMGRTDPFAISCWFRCSVGAGAIGYIFECATEDATVRGILISVNGTTGKVRFALRNSAATYNQVQGSTTVNNNVWRYLTCTSDGTGTVAGLSIRINGVDETLTTLSNTLGANTISDAARGCRWGIATDGTNWYPLVGKLCSMALHESHLITLAEHQDLYSGVDPRTLSTYPYLTHYWHGGTGDTYPIAKEWIAGRHAALTRATSAIISTDHP